MIKMDIEDFIYEVKEELICYDEIGEVGANDWESGFKSWLNNGSKKPNVKNVGNKKQFIIADESEIFDIADEYLKALENNNTDKYWKEFN